MHIAARAWWQRQYRPLMSRLYSPPLHAPLALWYRGDRVECPLCHGTFRSFMPVIRPVGPNRPRTRCPNCGARDRHRLLWLYLTYKTNLFSDRLRVLHFAPERILQKRLKAQQHLHYVSADLCRSRAIVHADITAIPFPENSFDVVLCSHVLEHVLHDRQAMRELYRVMKPTGWAVVLVPINSRREETYEDATIIAPRDRERVFGQADHVRIYGRDFKMRLQEAGFTVRVEDLRRELGEKQAQRYGLRPRKAQIHLCFKTSASLPAGVPQASGERRVLGL